jgi:hypothetical protein
MALYRPTNITPSSFSGLGNGTVDATKDMEVSWQVEGASAMTAYQIVIQQNDTDSTQVYDSGKVELETPFFGTTFTGNTQRFSATIAVSALTGLSNGYANGYKMLITQWWSEDDSVQQVQPSYFITRSEPTLMMDTIQNPLPIRVNTFSAAYSQEQGDTLNWFRWLLAVKGEEDAPLRDSGNIYGTEDIQFSYDGFFTGQTYTIRCICETENGVKADTGWVDFSVAYETSAITGVIQACRMQGVQDGLLVSWPSIHYIPGEAQGDYEISDGKLTLPSGSSVTWDKVNGASMRFESPWSAALRVQIGAVTGTLLQIDGLQDSIFVAYDGDGISVNLNGSILYRAEGHLTPGDIWTIAILPDSVWMSQMYSDGGPYPAEALYPAEDLFPYSTGMVLQRFGGPARYQQFTMTGLTLYGPGTFEFLWVVSGSFSAEQLQRLMTDASFSPEYGSGTLLLAGFNGNLEAGNLQSPTETIVGLALYRLLSGESRLRPVASVPLNDIGLIDYGFANQAEFQYYLFPQGEETYIAQPIVSPMVKPVFWNWTLLVCEADAEDPAIFHVQEEYVFANNVSSGAYSNNSTPTILKNFTPYPTIQMDTANYRSGTLTALIGRVDQIENRYIDSAGLAQEIMALSLDTRPKFLKDRKGNFMQVATSSAIIMTMNDAQAEQSVTVQIPWAEVGSAEDVSLIQTQADGIVIPAGI